MENQNFTTVSVKENNVITPKIAGYVERYHTFARKTAESIIGLATTLLEAEQQLNGIDFAIFCDEVGIRKGDSTYSKLRKIAMNASRFNPYLENLPNAFSTLYELAKLEPSKFQRIASDLTPFTTAKDVAEALSGQKQTQKEKDAIDLTISFGKIGSSKKKEIYNAISELKNQFKFTMKEGKLFIDEMKTVKQMKKVA